MRFHVYLKLDKIKDFSYIFNQITIKYKFYEPHQFITLRNQTSIG